uniref:Uncharacterized protein n=1 Tax=viral metagenome TaxID=1070528 RepID=A0A6M3LK35_9ZZZZ
MKTVALIVVAIVLGSLLVWVLLAAGAWLWYGYVQWDEDRKQRRER